MTWDLAEVIAEREQPRTEVVVYLNEFASHAKVQLQKALATETNPEKVAELEKSLADVDQALEESKYTVVLEALPSRMREDINSKAMHDFPLRRNPLGGLAAEDPTRERTNRENNLLIAAMIRDVLNPSGEHKESWTQEEVETFVGRLSSAAQRAIDMAIKQIHTEAELFTAEVKNPNL